MGHTLPLAGLILAQADDGAGSPALFGVAGQILVEYQARLAWGAGARHIVVMVDYVAPAMVAAFDRLRDDGIVIQIARDARDAADRIHPDEKLLLFAAGTFATRDAVISLATRTDRTLLTFANGDAPDGSERLDAAESWAGLALLSGKDLRSVATMLGDWALAPTLVRSAVQQLVARERISATDGVALVGSEAELTAALASGKGIGTRAGPFDRYVAAPLAGLIARRTLDLPIPFELASVIGPVLLATAVLLAALGWIATGLAVYIAALIVGKASEWLAMIALRNSGLIDWRTRLELAALAALLLATGVAADSEGLGWGSMVLALWAAINLALPESEAGKWPGEAALAMIVATVAGWPLVGLGAIIGAQLAVRWRHRLHPAAIPEPALPSGELSR